MSKHRVPVIASLSSSSEDCQTMEKLRHVYGKRCSDRYGGSGYELYPELKTAVPLYSRIQGSSKISNCYLRQGLRPLKGPYKSDFSRIFWIFRAHMGPCGPGQCPYEGESL